MGIDHVTVPVADYERSKRFYERALRPLGFVVLLDWPDRRRAYLGVEHAPSALWLVESEAPGGLEVCLAAPDAEAVEAFRAAAVAAGARAAGAAVLDPDGNLIGAVHRVEAGALAA